MWLPVTRSRTKNVTVAPHEEPAIEELRESLGAPGEEVAQGDPWEVTLPTNLVLLRGPSSLPKWRKDGNGSWVPDEEPA